MNNLPKLSSKEEFIHLANYKKTGNKKAKELLVLHSLRVVMPFINKFGLKLKEDLINEACLYICHALEKTKIEKGCQFSSYAYMFAKKYICRYVTKLNKQNTAEFDDNYTIDINTPDEVTNLYDALSKLDKEEQEIIKSLYFYGYTKNECPLAHRNTLVKKERRALQQLGRLLGS